MYDIRLAAALCLVTCLGSAAFSGAPTAPAQAATGSVVQGRGQGGRGRGAAAPRTRKAVLAWADTRNGIAQHESVSHALAVIERLGYESGTYDTFIRTDSHIVANQPLMTTGMPASGGPSLANVDAIFFLGHREVPLELAAAHGPCGVRSRFGQRLRRRSYRSDRVRFLAGIRRPDRCAVRRSPVECRAWHNRQRRSIVPRDEALPRDLSVH